MSPARILVTGSRDWDDYDTINRCLHDAFVAAGSRSDTILVHGDARGADSIAAHLWALQGLPTEAHPADWDGVGMSAGLDRNLQMIELGADVCLAFIKDSSPGATHCSVNAIKRGIRTYTIPYEGPSGPGITTN